MEKFYKSIHVGGAIILAIWYHKKLFYLLTFTYTTTNVVHFLYIVVLKIAI